MKPLRVSIFVRVLVVVLASGMVALVLAAIVASSVVEDALEAQLVEAAVQRAETISTRVDHTVELTRAELAAVALAADAGRPLDASRIVSAPAIALRCARGSDVLFEAATRADADELLRQTAFPPPGSVATVPGSPNTLAVTIGTGDIESVALVDASAIVGVPPGWTLEMSNEASRRREDPGLSAQVDAGGVLARRERGPSREELVRAVTTSRYGIVLSLTAPLAPARAASLAVTRNVVLWSVVIVIPLLLLAYVLARAVTSPVRSLAASVRQAGGRVVSLPQLPRDEIGDLGAAIRSMSERLSEDARALRAAVDFARRVNRMWLDSQVIAAAESALKNAIPTARWKVVSSAEIEDTKETSLAGAPTDVLRMLIRIETESSELSAPGRMLITPSDVKLRIASERVPRADGSGAEDDTLYLVLRYGARVFGVVVGRGVREAPTGHAELLCRITSAALQNLELIRSTLVNEKLAVLGRVMAAVAHEVNNPLTFVLANLRSLEAELDGNHREAATEAREGAERVGRIIGDLSSLSRSGQQVYPVRADLGALAREAARMARVRCPGGTVTVTIDAAGPAEISGDPNRLIQVLVNLIVNGLDAARGGESPRVEVRIHADDQGHVLVDVADSGPGIARSVLPRLFEAFFTTKGEEGTGLGLFISRSLARAHGGDLVLESTESGGSVFRLSLPRAEPTHEPEADAASMQTPSPAPRDPTPQPGFAERPSILVIDDEASLVRGLERWLGRWADVTGTTDARKGLELAASCKYDLVLCDLDMPHMNGREVLRALQESNPAAAARLVLMTGSSSVSAPDIKVLRKPIEEDAIKRLIVELRSRLAASSTAAE